MCAVLAMADVTVDGRDGDRNVLLLGAYAPATQVGYSKSAHRFLWWFAAHYGGRAAGTSGHDYYHCLDRALSDYMLELWLDGFSKVEASKTFYGLEMLHPGVKEYLPRSRRSLRGFNRLQPVQPRPPMPWPVAAAVAVWLAGRGQYRIGIAVLLSFDCYLRSGELLRLVREDFAPDDDPRLGFDVRGGARKMLYVHLRRAKTGKNQGVRISDEQVQRVITSYLITVPPGHRLFPFSKSTYYRWFHLACSSMSLSSEYVPHSLRHGAATRDYSAGMPIADVMVRGRWVATKSAIHYIQQGRQLMMMNQVPVHVDEVGRFILRDLHFSMLSAILIAECNARLLLLRSVPSIRSRRARK